MKSINTEIGSIYLWKNNIRNISRKIYKDIPLEVDVELHPHGTAPIF